MRKLILFFFMLMTFVHVNGQHGSSAPQSLDKVHLRVNFMGVLDEFDRNISLGGEYEFAKRWSAGLDAAHIFFSNYLSESEKTRGFILRPFVRYYYDEDHSGYLEGNLHFKNVNYQITGWLGKQVVDGIPAYEEFSTFNFNKKVAGIDLKIGRRFDLTKSNNIELDVFVGMGLRYKEQGAKNGRYNTDRSFLLAVRETSYTYPSLPMGLRLTFRL